MLYAVGEILLVVIGILIALQVNNWNEERKERRVEMKFFSNLKNDLHADLERLDYMIDLATAKVKASQNVKRLSDKDSVGSLYDFSDHMLDLIFVDEISPNENTYEEMKSSGNFSTIRNDTLKLQLLNLRKTYVDIDGSQKHMRNDFDLFLADFEKYIDWGNYFDLDKSNIPELQLVYDSVYIEGHRGKMETEVRELFKNKVFLNNIFLLEINYAYHMDLLKKTKVQIGEILGVLEQELQMN
jgi:hypothetical protein